MIFLLIVNFIVYVFGVFVFVLVFCCFVVGVVVMMVVGLLIVIVFFKFYLLGVWVFVWGLWNEFFMVLGVDILSWVIFWIIVVVGIVVGFVGVYLFGCLGVECVGVGMVLL